MKKPKEKGIAILIVISSLMLLTTLVVEFAYNTNVTYHLALNEKDRTQSYYLAQSAIQFSRVVLKYDKEAKQMISKASERLGKPINVQPLYKMVPINSALLRMLTGNSESGPEKSAIPEELAKTEEANKALSGFDTKKAQDFLAFEGDFSAEIEAQDGKFPLNAFYDFTPTQKEYDRLKITLTNLLMQKPFEALLKIRVQESKELAGKIADYIDRNDSINELGGSERGSESSLYSGLKQKPKNGKLLTVDELILIPGITENLLTELKKYVTVYKSTDKINICEGSDELLRAMILTYTQESAEPIRFDNEERLKTLVEKVRGACPDASGMSQALNEALGVAAPSSSSGSPATQPSGGGASSGGGSNNFSSMLSNDQKIFSIEGIGIVGEAQVKIVNVIDTSSPNPEQWRDLYWRVE